jgi:hypothetical protein
MVRALVNPAFADWMRRCHPLRLQYELFSNRNPAMAAVEDLADQVREQRSPAKDDNPFVAMQQQASEQVVAALDGWRRATEAFCEGAFLTVFGSPFVQAALGVDPASAPPARKAAANPLHRQLLGMRIAELRSRIPAGGLREAVVRALIYVGMQRRAIDERGFEMARRIREAHGEMSLAEFKMLVREQFNMLLIDQDAALAAIPDMLPAAPEVRRNAFILINQILSARGDLSDEDRARLDEVAHLLGVAGEADARRRPQPEGRAERKVRAS